MLSVSRIKTASRAAAYYGRDDYYVTGEADAPGLVWGGKGAERLGLHGMATPREFKAVLGGVNPDQRGPAISTADRGARHHPGWDFTFSAPKSVSVAILVGGDHRLDAAHDRAVDKAMAYAERTLSFTRVRTGQERREVLTGNLVYAKTVHGVSREGDPQRHTHVVLANTTFDRQGGTWRALESRHLYKRRMLLGKIYQAEMAREAMALGHHVRKGPGEGLYELDAWRRDQLRMFAKRTEAILQALAIEKPATAAARDAVKLKGRPNKIERPRDELLARWRQDAARAGLDVDRIVADAGERERGQDRTPLTAGRVSEVLSRARSAVAGWIGQRPAPDPYRHERGEAEPDVAARQAVSMALQACEIRSAVFTRHEVIERALDWASAGVGLDRIEADLARLEQTGRVLPAGRRMCGGLTTARAIGVEAEIVRRIDEGRGRGCPALSRAEIAGRLVRHEADGGLRLNDGQRSAVGAVLSSEDRYIAVQGSAGVGKTTMFRAVRQLADEAGRPLTAITPTHRAATAMKKEAGVYATTVAAWLATMDKALVTRSGRKAVRRFWADRILVVDEASMVSNAQMLAITDVVERAGVRSVVLMGDERQLGSPEAGAPFRLLLGREVDQARVRDILRQEDPTLRESVYALAEGKAARALALIEKNILEVGRGAGDQGLAEAAVQHWKHAQARGESPRIVVPTNALRGAVADLVRTERIAAGELAASGELRDRYQQVRLAGPERFSARSYRLGQRLVFHASAPAAGLPRGAEADVAGIDLRNDVLRVATPLGDQTLDLRAFSRVGRIPFDAYRPKSMEVAEGEQLVWERAEPKRGFLTGAAFTVVAMNDRHWIIRHEDGREEQLRADDPVLRFIGYGYAETADRAQGQTYRSVIAAMSSRHGEAVSTARQYVMQSRPSDTFTLITDDRRLLVMKLAAQDGLNPIALDSIGAAMLRIGEPAHDEPIARDKADDLAKGASPTKVDGRSL